LIRVRDVVKDMMDIITNHHAMKIGHYRPLKTRQKIVMTSPLLLEVLAMRLQGTLNKDAVCCTIKTSITTKNCSEEMELLEGYSQVG
jgi:hypothetical protein